MSEQTLAELLREAAFVFVGTVEDVGAETVGEIPSDEQPIVVRVDRVLVAPPAFAQLAGSRVTLRGAADEPAVQGGDSWVFFANGLAFAESLALQEVGRRKIDDLESHVSLTTDESGADPLRALSREVAAARLAEHASVADAIVLGRVIGLERAAGSPVREHDPDWWLATLHVVHVERGDVPEGNVKVLYANSIDVRWREAPKPKAAQNGLWILHATDGDLRDLAPFQLLHSDDFQPPQMLESLRDNEG
jgi:hypothetical protein